MSIRSLLFSALFAGLTAMALPSHAALPEVAAPSASSPLAVHSRTIEIDGINIFYREAGNPDAPTIVLLHGFPSSSHSFRELIPALATKFHVIAPDYPGYGYSDAPTRGKYAYTFDSLAKTVDRFLDKVAPKEYLLYMHDFGGPIGFRIALAHPERVKGLVVQNANAYEEGLSKAFASSRKLWQHRSPETEAPIRHAFSPDGIKWQYLTGARNAATMTRDGYSFDTPLMQRPGRDLIQLDMIEDYRSNVALFPQWQQWIKTAQPKTLIVFGKGDPLFTVEGARAMARDNPNAQLILFDGGHFMLEEYSAQVATEILKSFGK